MSGELRTLVLSAHPLSPETTCVEAYERFEVDEDLLTLAVVDGGMPVGLVNRHEFFLRLAHLFGRSLYDKRPISALMNADPLIVDVGTSLESLHLAIVTEKPSALLQGFIVTEDGRFLGVGTALSLVQLTIQHMDQRAEELEAARLEAERANRIKSEFLASMSHEFRTPLNAIIGFAQLMVQQRLGVLGSPRYLEYATDICQSGEILLGLVNDLLDVSKIEAGKMRLDESVLDPRDAIRQCARAVRPRADRGGVEVVAEVPAALPLLYADERRLQQVLLNLLSNAVKFTPEGGRVTVEARIEPERGGLVLAVADTGIGMSPADLERVWLPFVQVQNVQNRVNNGSGLGLAVAKSLVELHGGTLTIESTLGGGTTVTVWLPGERLIEETDEQRRLQTSA